ncbi:uncharacterized protein LOC142342809 isoform X2 [Convolutriloba macropyga]|uniref:uncharacterized protein LOC142342809 isoform X2 n=1 Tax=Convolutriloba macropyga TaxID=536237 RepID=UPI003F51FE38
MIRGIYLETLLVCGQLSLMVTGELNIDQIKGFEVEYDSKPTFDNSSSRESLYDSSVRSYRVTDLKPDTIYLFRVRVVLSVPGKEGQWSNVVAVETRGPDSMLAVVLTFGNEVQAVKPELLKKMVTDTVGAALGFDLSIQSLTVKDVKSVLESPSQPLTSATVVKAYTEVVYKNNVQLTPDRIKQLIVESMNGQATVDSFKNVEVFVQPDITACSDPNQEFRECGSRCVKTCQQPEENSCAASSNDCVAGCFCNPGFIYDTDNFRCIPEERCRVTCPDPNEQFTDCGLSCFESCSPNIRRRCRGKCLPGCYCKEGFARVGNKCVPLTSCPLCDLVANRVFKDCGVEKSCFSELDRFDNLTCASGCFCMDGYLEYEGRCIAESECKSYCPTKPNMVFSTCGNLPCEKTCQDSLQNLCRISNDHISNSLCRSGCYCDEGFVKDLKSKLCVLRQDCPAECTDPNQSFRLCDENCVKRCDGSILCLSNSTCRVGQCVCNQGYVSSSQLSPLGASMLSTGGRCERDPTCSTEKIMGCGRRNATYQCKNKSCEANCSNVDISCPDQNDLNCEWDCFCNPGFVRNAESNCVLSSDCPLCPNVNTEYTNCGCDKSCSEPDDTECKSCNAGCFCKEGYAEYRGYCIPRSQCPGNCPNGMMFSDCATCKPTCTDRTPFCRGCIPGCTCKTGFFLHNGQCITETDCEIELADTPCLLADKNSTYSDSIRCQPSCRDPSPAECDNRATDPMQGCMCKSGYIFNGTNCILPVDCTIKLCPDENSEVVRCSKYCERSCGEPDVNNCEGQKCDSGCLCKRGYYRNSVGLCVKMDECPICAKNMHFEQCGCHSYCQGKKAVQSVCNCTSGCFCDPGFFWFQNKCLPQTMCYKGFVEGAPQVVPAGMKRFNGESVQFLCSTELPLSPPIIWYHNSTRVSATTGDGSYWTEDTFLNIRDVQIRHSGSYQCAVYIDEEPTPVVSKAALLQVEMTGLSRIQASLNATQVTVKEGQYAAFKCNVKSDKAPTIMWRFRGGQLPKSQYIQVLPSSNILAVSTASQSLQGEYSCIAYHPDGESAYAAVKLVVLTSSGGSGNRGSGENDGGSGGGIDNSATKQNVSLVVDSGSYIGMEGKPIQLKCLVWGADPMLITWQRSNASINELFAKITTESFTDYAVSILLFTRLRRADTGVYTCSIPTMAYVKAQITYLLVERSKTWFQLQIFPRSDKGVLTVARGQNVTLKCHVTNGTAVPTIDWYYNNSLRLPDSIAVTLNTLLHRKIQTSGNYMCSGSHGNEQQFVSVFVNVTDAPGDSSNGTDVNPSDTPGLPIDPNDVDGGSPKVLVEIWETSPFNYNITCSLVNGGRGSMSVNPSEVVSLNWLFNDSYDFPRNVLPVSPTMLMLNNARLENAGVFTCVVMTRDQNKYSGSAQLSFLADPSLPESAPIVSVSPKSVVVEKSDEIVRLFCMVKSRTDPVRINWVATSTQQSMGSYALLEIRASDLTQKKDTFTCFASNFYGTSSQSITIEKLF